MSTIATFTFSPFSENTYVVHDETGECVIIDPGCSNDAEREELTSYISKNTLKPALLLNTHCHLDHVFGNKFCADTYGLELWAHAGEKEVLEYADVAAKMYGVPLEPSPPIKHFLEDGDTVAFGSTSFGVLLTPGHSPASICFYSAADGFCVVGDTLFRESIGRTDLPGGDLDTLMTSIKSKLLVLPDETVLHPGHMGPTTVGYEKASNPFLKAYAEGKLG